MGDPLDGARRALETGRNWFYFVTDRAEADLPYGDGERFAVYVDPAGKDREPSPVIGGRFSELDAAVEHMTDYVRASGQDVTPPSREEAYA